MKCLLIFQHINLQLACIVSMRVPVSVCVHVLVCVCVCVWLSFNAKIIAANSFAKRFSSRARVKSSWAQKCNYFGSKNK